ncbi:MAG: nuclease A inhibitor family protein [Leptolyngbyaceae cyanobacterium]
MNPTTARMLEELRQLTDLIVFSTEGDHYVDPFIWEPAEQGELTLDRLLEAEGYIEQVEIESVFPQNKQFPRETPSTELTPADEKQMELLNFLQSRCVSVEVHVVSKNDALSKWDRDHPDEQSIIEPFEGFPIILAETDTDEWVGIAPEVYFEEWYDYRPHEEESLWSTAFLFRNNVPIDDRADCYVRFNLESLLSRLDVPLRLKSGRATTVKQRFLELHEDKLPKIMAYQNTQAEEATLSLIEEIKQRLMGMEL